MNYHVHPVSLRYNIPQLHMLYKSLSNKPTLQTFNHSQIFFDGDCHTFLNKAKRHDIRIKVTNAMEKEEEEE